MTLTNNTPVQNTKPTNMSNLSSSDLGLVLQVDTANIITDEKRSEIMRAYMKECKSLTGNAGCEQNDESEFVPKNQLAGLITSKPGN